MQTNCEQTINIYDGALFIDGTFHKGNLSISGQTISCIRLHKSEHTKNNSDTKSIDATNCYVIPGLIDLHLHGANGADLCDGTTKALDDIARYEAINGVTSICPATMTYPLSTLEPIVQNVCSFVPNKIQANILGITMEGPYISPEKVGAQNSTYVRDASTKEFFHLQELAKGKIRTVCVAPEYENNLEFIKSVASKVRVSIAHTATSYECAQKAFRAGAVQLTHTFNAMPGLHHRHPGPIAAALEQNNVYAELIADGVHVHPAMVRILFSLFGPERLLLISDTMRATGLGNGIFDLGGQKVHVEGNVAKLVQNKLSSESNTIAGSVTNLTQCLRIAVKDMGIPLEYAIKAATENPARALGIQNKRGAIKQNAQADIVILDSNLKVKQVILRGKMLLN